MALETRVTIVGCGPGDGACLTDEARAAVSNAAIVVGAARLLELFPDCSAKKTALDGSYATAADRIADWRREGPVAVLVSGDPGACSLSALILRRLGRDACRIIPGISSVQVAFARLGLPWFGARMLSVHARGLDLEAAELADDERIAVLGGNDATRAELVKLARALLPTHRGFWCRDLSLPEEEVAELDEATLGEDRVAGLGLLVLARRGLFTEEQGV